MLNIGASELQVAFGAGSFVVGVYAVILARRQSEATTKARRPPKDETPEGPTSEVS